MLPILVLRISAEIVFVAAKRAMRHVRARLPTALTFLNARHFFA